MKHPVVNIGIRAARNAGRELIRMLNRIDQLSVTEKAIISEIRKAFPDHAILSEESGQSGHGDTRWLIDPLDGTRNYIQGLPHFCVSLAVQEKGVTEHGIIYDPIRDELFTASRGNGAFLNDHRMRISDRRDLNIALLGTGFPFRNKQYLRPYLRMFRSLFEQASDVRRAGSAALDLAYVASGRLDGFWEIGLKPWDIAAGALMIKEAGGHCTAFNSGEVFLKTGNIIAANLKLTAAIHTHIRPHLTESLKS